REKGVGGLGPQLYLINQDNSDLCEVFLAIAHGHGEEENRAAGDAVLAEIRVTPLWLLKATRAADAESKYRAIIEQRESLGERYLPNADHARRLAELGNAPQGSLAAADELERVGLFVKARRRLLCGVVGLLLRCSNTECWKFFWRACSCKLRYCPNCAPKLARDLMRRYAGLSAL